LRTSFLLFLILLAVPAVGKAADKKKKSGSDMVCRNSEVTGSRVLGSKVCKSRSQWQAEKDDLDRELLKSQRQGIQQTVVDTRSSPKP